MSASVIQRDVWDWWCAECCAGAGPFYLEEAVERMALEHDEEQHSGRMLNQLADEIEGKK